MPDSNSNAGGSQGNAKHRPLYTECREEVWKNIGRKFPERLLPIDIAFLHRYGLSHHSLKQASVKSVSSSKSAAEIMISEGHISEIDYFKCMADYLNLPFDNTELDISRCLGELANSTNKIENAKLTLVRGRDQSSIIYTSPDRRIMAELKKFLDKYPALKTRTVITIFSNNRRTFIARRRGSLVRSAIFFLRKNFPAHSAKPTITNEQSIIASIVATIVTFGIIFFSKTSLFLLHIFGSIFYLMCIWVRMIAAFYSQPKMLAEQQGELRADDIELPVYSVLVALYQEENQIKDLIRSLSKLDWPKSKLEIKLICEGDDLASIDAIKAAIHGPPFELIIVPPTLPRTKPKALNFAFPLCAGRYLVLYDAEDRPHPHQLREAYSRFCSEEKNIACLQAPLVIHNAEQGWLTSLFAIEYSALFSGLLPTLAKWKTPIPLGGTSNHFRRSALEYVGAWDPYNVTEDADLGIRLSRMGFLTGTLNSPTYEEAPSNLGSWIRQRTRWFKGWLQTWLVHMRNPSKLRKDLGWYNTFIFHAVITGMIVSALTHPFFLISLASTLYYIAVTPEVEAFYIMLTVVDISNILFGYIAFSVLAWRTLPVSGLKSLRPKLIGVPIYWLLISAAAWRAVWHLIMRPFEWEKTTHVLTSADNK